MQWDHNVFDATLTLCVLSALGWRVGCMVSNLKHVNDLRVCDQHADNNNNTLETYLQRLHFKCIAHQLQSCSALGSSRLAVLALTCVRMTHAHNAIACNEVDMHAVVAEEKSSIRA